MDNSFRTVGLCSSLPAELGAARDQVLLGIIAKTKGTVRSVGCENCCWCFPRSGLRSFVAPKQSFQFCGESGFVMVKTDVVEKMILEA